MRTTPQENAALVRRFLTDVVVGGDTDAIDTFLTDDPVDHNLVFGERRRQDAMMTLGWRVLAAADVGVEIDDVVATGEQVAVRATVIGTHTKSLMDLAPTGASFEIDYVWFFRIHDGSIAEIWSLPDGLGLMQQLGALPEPSVNRLRTEQNQHLE
ncbi:MAG: ester cyclase [Halopenitus sp.]